MKLRLISNAHWGDAPRTAGSVKKFFKFHLQNFSFLLKSFFGELLTGSLSRLFKTKAQCELLSVKFMWMELRCWHYCCVAICENLQQLHQQCDENLYKVINNFIKVKLKGQCRSWTSPHPRNYGGHEKSILIQMITFCSFTLEKKVQVGRYHRGTFYLLSLQSWTQRTSYLLFFKAPKVLRLRLKELLFAFGSPKNLKQQRKGSSG